MTIFSGEGNQRAGKNVFTTSFAIYLSKLGGNVPIYANYHMKVPKEIEFHYFEKFSEIMNVKNAIIVFDEIGTTADARTWNGKEQTLFTHKFAQMGKDGNTFISTAQRPYLVEKRVREQADYVIWCDKDIFTGKLYQTWYDTRQGRFNARKIGTYQVNPNYLTEIYEQYDTFEHIASHVKFDDQINR